HGVPEHQVDDGRIVDVVHPGQEVIEVDERIGARRERKRGQSEIPPSRSLRLRAAPGGEREKGQDEREADVHAAQREGVRRAGEGDPQVIHRHGQRHGGDGEVNGASVPRHRTRGRARKWIPPDPSRSAPGQITPLSLKNCSAAGWNGTPMSAPICSSVVCPIALATEARSCWFSTICSSTPVTVSSGRSQRTTRRSEEHTSELQSRENLVCRLLLEK